MRGQTVHVVGVSGGKDSGITAKLAAIRAEKTGMSVRFVNTDTGNEAPWHHDHLDQMEAVLGAPIARIKQDFSEAIARRRERLPEQWGAVGVPQALIDRALSLMHPTGNPYLDLVLSKGMFAAGARRKFCTEELKIRPCDEQIVKPLLSAGTTVIQWFGIRSDESAKRADVERHPRFQRPGLHAADGHGRLLNYRPILDWSVEMVVAAHEYFGVPMNPAYGYGFSRYGCFPCVNERKGSMAIIARRFPEQVARIREWEKIVSQASVAWRKRENFEARDISTFFPTGTVPGLRRNTIEDVATWSLTARGGRQLDYLAGFIPDQQFYACTGGTGWCEAA